MKILNSCLFAWYKSFISSNVNGSPSKYKKANNRASTGDKSNNSIVFENSSMILFVISLLISDIKSHLKALLYKGYNKITFLKNRKLISKLGMIIQNFSLYT